MPAGLTVAVPKRSCTVELPARAPTPAGAPPRPRPLDDHVEVLGDAPRAADPAPRRRRPGVGSTSAAARPPAAHAASPRPDEAIGAIIYHPRPMSSPPPRRLRRGLLAALGVLLVLAGGAVAFVLANKPGDVSHPDVEFTTDVDRHAPPPRPQAVDRFLWPTYGYRDDRTRNYGDAPDYLRPGFRRGWTYRSGVLLEFPPTIDGGSLYLLDDDGMLRALDEDERADPLEQRKSGGSPPPPPPSATGASTRSCCRGLRAQAGRIAAYRAGDGRQVWSRALPSRAESSPLLRNGRIFFGSEDGTVYALEARKRPHDLDVQGQRRGEGRPGARQRDALLRRLRRQGARRQREERQRGVVGRHERHALRLRLGQLLLDRRSRLRARLSRQHRRPRLLVRRQQRRRSRGRRAPAPTSTAPPPSRPRRASDRPSTSAPTTAASTRSTRAPARVRWSFRVGREDLRLGDDRRRRRLLLRPEPDNDTLRPDVRTGKQVYKFPGRRVQPGRRRPPRDLPRRLREPLRAAAQARDAELAQSEQGAAVRAVAADQPRR